MRQLGRHAGARFCSFLFSQYPHLLLHCLGCSGLTGARPEGMGRGWVCLFFRPYLFSPLVMSCSFLGLRCPVLCLPFLPFPVLSFPSHFLPFPVLVLSFLCSSHTFSGFYHAVPYRPFLFVLSCHDCSLHPIASLSFSCLSFPPLSLLFPKSFSFSILPLSLSCSCSPPCLLVLFCHCPCLFFL